MPISVFHRFLPNCRFFLLPAITAFGAAIAGCVSTPKHSSLLDSPRAFPAVTAVASAAVPDSAALLSSEDNAAADSMDAVDDTLAEDPGELIQDARSFCRDSNFAAADSVLRLAIKGIETTDAEGQDEHFPATRYMKDIISIYEKTMPASFPIPDEIAVSAFQWQFDQSLDSIRVPPSDSVRLLSIENQKGVTYDVPMVWNDQVLGAMEFFVRNRRNTIDRWFPRASRYLPYMRQMFADSGLPRDLAYLPLIESAFNPVAYSYARASGIWQFIASTGSLYGLRRSYWVDERRDPIRSTVAAIKYFKKLWGDFGDWHLCLAAYNCGEGAVSRAIARSGVPDFWKLRLPAQTRGYVPTYLAAVTIAKNPKDFNVSMPEGEVTSPDTVVINDCVRLDDIAHGIGISCDSLRKLNPHMLRWCTPPDATSILYLPSGSKDSFSNFYAQLPAEKKVRWCYYQIKRGDDIHKIAARFEIPVSEIVRINRLRRERVASGRYLFLPLPGAPQVASAEPSYIPPVKVYVEEPAGHAVVYRVRKGDGLRKIARKYHTSVVQLCQLNRISRSAALKPGRIIIVKAAPAAEADEVTPEKKPARVDTYVVQQGDTPFSIASHAGIGLKDLLSWNELDSDAPVIKVGDTLRLTAPATLAKSKGNVSPSPRVAVAHHKAAAADIATPQASATTGGRSYTVRRGDNLFRIARKHGLHLQTLLAFNHFTQRTRIHPGMVIAIPGDNSVRSTAITPVSASKVVYYRVRQGDTLPVIASTFGIPIEKLSSDNNLSPDSVILPGEIIKVVRGR